MAPAQAGLALSRNLGAIVLSPTTRVVPAAGGSSTMSAQTNSRPARGGVFSWASAYRAALVEFLSGAGNGAPQVRRRRQEVQQLVLGEPVAPLVAKLFEGPRDHFLSRPRSKGHSDAATRSAMRVRNLAEVHGLYCRNVLGGMSQRIKQLLGGHDLWRRQKHRLRSQGFCFSIPAFRIWLRNPACGQQFEFPAGNAPPGANHL